MPLGVINHPSIDDPNFTTIILSWFDGGLRFFEPVPSDSGGFVILDTYYLSYATVIAIAWFLHRRWQRAGTLFVRPHQLYDLAIVTILAVLFGAKIAYVLFYNFEYYAENPLEIITNWSGMSSHGAFAGVAFGFWWYCRAQRLNFLHIADHAVIGGAFAPVFVRVANWLNGELYGRSVGFDAPWSMRFPMRDGLGRVLYVDHTNTVYSLHNVALEAGASDYRLVALEKAPHHAFESYQNMVELFPMESYGHLWGYVRVHESDTVIQVARCITDASHQSQIYEMILGGFGLLTILFLVKARAKIVGTVAATFLIGYGVVRIIVEAFRQQDPQRSESVFQYVSMGQWLSIALVCLGILMLRISKRRGVTIESLRTQWKKSELARLAARGSGSATRSTEDASDTPTV